MALIRLRICAGWSEALLVLHTTLLEISCRDSYAPVPTLAKALRRWQLAVELKKTTPNTFNHIWASVWDFQQFAMCNQQSLRSACAYAQSDQSLCLLIEYSMTVKLLTEHHFEFLSLKRGCTGSSESTLVKMSNCWKSPATAQLWSFSNTDLTCLHGLFQAHNLYFQTM